MADADQDKSNRHNSHRSKGHWGDDERSGAHGHDKDLSGSTGREGNPTTPDRYEVERATLLLQEYQVDTFSAVVPAIYQTSLFTFRSFAEMREALEGANRHFVYTRGRNPTVQAFEEKVAMLEGAEAACAFSSGMAAITATILSYVSAGDRIVCIRNVYPDAHKLMTRLLPRLSITTDFVDGTDTAAVIANLGGTSRRKPAKLLYLESPTSQMFELQDIATLAHEARRLGVVTVMDNSWATPLGQRPLDHGVDLVLHSASKYLSGHSDVVAGVVAGSRQAINCLRDAELMVLGAKLSPFEAWLLLRGLRTLPLRLERHERSALEVARFLERQPLVRRVCYPGLDSHEQSNLFRKYFSRASGLLSFEFTHESAVEPFVDALQLFRIGVSWGGYESLVYPVLLTYLSGGPHSAAHSFNVPRNLVRLHVGLEDPADLIADLTRALDAATKGGVPMKV